VIPKLKDRCASIGSSGGCVLIASRLGPIGGLDQSGSVMREPPRESVVRSGFAKVFEDLLAEADDGILIDQ
jgi:hypothetical protein